MWPVKERASAVLAGFRISNSGVRVLEGFGERFKV
jgi:hypothetical protein